VLAANGPAFCAGHDLKEMRSLEGREAVAAVFTLCSKVMTAIVRLPQPVIARVHAMATAAGCQLVASCDLAYAAASAQFATPGVNIGLFCSTPMVALSRAVGRKQAMEMLLSGQPIDAATAECWGLINRAVAPERLEAEVAAMAGRIAAKSSHTVKVGKQAFHRQLEMGLDDAYAYCSEVMTANMMARDAAEGIDAFLAKRPPRWEGC
jgi:enoyl-CoA hydratase/carnithine racemase